MHLIYYNFFSVFAEKNPIASFAYSSENSSIIPVVHTFLFFFYFIFTNRPGYQAPWLCRFDTPFNTSDVFSFNLLQSSVFQMSVYHYLGWRINKLKPNSKEINYNPNINKQAHGLTDPEEAFYFLLLKRGQYKWMQHTFSPLMVFFKAFFWSKSTYSRKTLTFCVSTPILPAISLWFDEKPLLSRNLQQDVSLKLT